MLQRLDGSCSYVLADPATERMLLPFATRGRARDDLAYLRESNPIANHRRFTRNVLQAQVDADRSVLISPWWPHGLDATGSGLVATLRFAENAANSPLIEGRELLVGVALTESVVRSEQARNEVLDQLVEGPEYPVYLRVLVTPPASFTQYRDGAVLEGLREIVASLGANGRSVLLPQNGLAGWLMLGFGAVAFGAGINGSLQRYAMPREGGGGGQPPLEWYFLPGLLGFVLRSEVADLAEVDGFESCPCPYCPALPFGAGGAWNRNAAGNHFLWWCSTLAEEVRAAGDRALAVRDRLASATAYWDAVQEEGVVLDQRSVPQHLEAWSDAVS
jgi:hypothetical protein